VDAGERASLKRFDILAPSVITPCPLERQRSAKGVQTYEAEEYLEWVKANRKPLTYLQASVVVKT